MSSWLLEAKDLLQIPKGTQRPHQGGIERFLFDHRIVICYPLFKRKKSLYSTQHSNALRQLATEVVNMVIEGQREANCDSH